MRTHSRDTPEPPPPLPFPLSPPTPLMFVVVVVVVVVLPLLLLLLLLSVASLLGGRPREHRPGGRSGVAPSAMPSSSAVAVVALLTWPRSRAATR